MSHQQAVAEHWDLPNTEISRSKDVASVQGNYTNFISMNNILVFDIFLISVA
jgi:hypothetical protein